MAKTYTAVSLSTRGDCSRTPVTKPTSKQKQSFSELCANELAILIGDKEKLDEPLSKHPNCIVFGQTNQESDFVTTEGNKILKTFVNNKWLRYSRLSKKAKTKLTRDFLIKLKDGNKEEGLPPHVFIQKEGKGEDAIFYQYNADYKKAFDILRGKIRQALCDRKRAEDEKKEKAIKKKACTSVNSRSSANMISDTTVSHENVARSFAAKNNGGSIPTQKGSNVNPSPGYTFRDTFDNSLKEKGKDDSSILSRFKPGDYQSGVKRKY